MAKKCIICGQEAEYRIKDTSDYYCSGCGIENFNDLAYLQKVEEEALRLKEAVKEKLGHKQEDAER